MSRLPAVPAVGRRPALVALAIVASMLAAAPAAAQNEATVRFEYAEYSVPEG